MHRFFVDQESFGQDKIIVAGPDVKHISRVLRLGPGEIIELLDGCGQAARAQIESIGRDAVVCSRLEIYEPPGEPPVRVVLLQGLPKGEKMESIIQKATELGVSEIVPVACRRSMVQLGGDRAGARRERWQRVAMEAAKQCRRPLFPIVRTPENFVAAINSVSEGALFLLPWEGEHNCSLKEVLVGGVPGEIFIFIGPEGGFDPEEVRQAVGRGAVAVSLGPRILRTETAGPACLAAVMFRWGDLG
jgi:16S rRNA (uracil1498-N3)-methyltransferase